MTKDEVLNNLPMHSYYRDALPTVAWKGNSGMALKTGNEQGIDDGTGKNA
jgi:hypothetical protein